MKFSPTIKDYFNIVVLLIFCISGLIGAHSIKKDIEKIQGFEKRKNEAFLNYIFNENRHNILNNNYDSLVIRLGEIIPNLNSSELILKSFVDDSIISIRSSFVSASYINYKHDYCKTSLDNSMLRFFSGCSDQDFFYYFDKGQNSPVLSLSWTSYNSDLKDKTISSMNLFFGLLFVFLFVILLINHLFSKVFIKPLLDVSEALSGSTNKKLTLSDLDILKTPPFTTSEVSKLYKSYHDFVSRVIALEGEIKKNAENVAGAKLALSLAHDIRSPVLALEMFLDNDHIDNAVIKNAIQRINEISQNLLSEYKVSQTKKTNLCLSISSVVEEKQIQYDPHKIEIFLDITNVDSENVFVTHQVSVDLQRILSNMIDNSFDAAKKGLKCMVNIVVARKSSSVIEVVVKDNGKGIDSEVLPRLFERGATFGKVDGNGLALFHAKEIVTKWGADIQIRSEKNKYTEIQFSVPFEVSTRTINSLRIDPCEPIIILDDDVNVYNLWKKKLGGLIDIDKFLIYFNNPDMLMGYEFAVDPQLLLIDYDLGPSDLNGIDVIRQISRVNKSILVTSKAGDVDVIEKVNELGCGLLDKSDILGLNISSTQNSSLSVLIDDDPLVRNLWVIKANLCEVDFKAYSTISDMLNDMNSIPKNSKIYIDSNLNEGKGEALSRLIFDEGYTEIFLTTGFSNVALTDFPWIKSVLDKNPPFSRNRK